MEYPLTFDAYNKALKKNRLMGIKCGTCATVTAPPRMVCPKCGGTDFSVVELLGKGTIKTFTTNFVAAENREGEAPYTIVLVELDEGPWVMGNLMVVDPAVVTMDIIGRRVAMGGLGPKVFVGDKYSAGDGARPYFNFEA
jgi:uncharacterized OB-fold protein